jgi:hypothetical protein
MKVRSIRQFHGSQQDDESKARFLTTELVLYLFVGRVMTTFVNDGREIFILELHRRSCHSHTAAYPSK